MHPNEPHLVFRSDAGNYLPTPDYKHMREAADKLGLAYLQALQVQVARQSELLG